MIPSGRRVDVLVHREPVDMRKHYDGLWGLVTALGRDPFDGALYAFIGKTRKRAKLLWWDGTGVVVLCKRLDKGRFVAPWERPGRGPLVLTPSELSLLLEGSEVVGRMRLSPEPWTPAQAASGR